jgi:hypothetical protein
MRYKPDGPPGKTEEIREDIMKLYKAKNGHQETNRSRVKIYPVRD